MKSFRSIFAAIILVMFFFNVSTKKCLGLDYKGNSYEGCMSECNGSLKPSTGVKPIFCTDAECQEDCKQFKNKMIV